MELTDYIRIVKAHWLAIIALTALGCVVAFGWTFTQTKVFAANATGIVTLSAAATDIGTQSVGDSLAKSKATTYVGLGESRAVAQLVVNSLDLAVTPESLVGHVTVSNVKDTPTIAVSATADTATGAKALADAWITALASQIRIVETHGETPPSASTSTASSEIILIPVESAVVPAKPISPDVTIAALIGALVGLILGVIYGVVRNIFDRRIRTSEMVERIFGLSVIGTLPKNKRLTHETQIATGPKSTDNSANDSDQAFGEALRELRTNLQFMDVDNPPRIIVVTSPLPNDGKSTVTANLAVTLAEAGEKVVVVDGDLRKPSVTATFGIVPGVGITDLLIGKAELQDVLQPWGVTGNLNILGAGSIPPNPSELLGSQGMNILLHELAKTAIVLIDAPPLLPVTDAAILAARVDGAIVVISAAKTTTDQLQKALTNITKTQGRTLGIVLNRVPTKGGLGRGYGYYASYYASSPSQISAEDSARAVNKPIRLTDRFRAS